MKGTHALVLLTALAVAGGCAGGSSPGTPAGTPPPTATSTPLTTEARQTTTTTSPATAWATTPTTVPHSPAVPPVPVLTGIRYAAHDGYDRIVLDIPGALPGYSVKYVPEVSRDGSGEPVSIPGKAFLLITLHPAQAHRANGAPTVTGIHRTGLGTIQAYGIVGDYEGYVSIALGVNGVRKYHVGELSDRIYLDVAV
jgi:hypothetical protein